MKKIYTGIDLGSFSIKIVVCEVVNNKFHVLAASNTRCKGIKNGLVTDMEEASIYLKKAKKEVEDMLGITIDQAVVTVPSIDKDFDIVEGKVNVEDENKMVSATDINNVFQDAVLGKVNETKELITITPIFFQVDDKEPVKDPKGMVGESLFVKAVITSIPKENFRNTVNLLKNCGITPVDVTYGIMGDYYEARNIDFDKSVSAIINIGYSKTEVSIFNKGIMIKDEMIDSGSKLIDKDLSYVYNLKRSQARTLKENFAVSNTRYSDVNDTIELTNKNGDDITLNQLEVSEVVEARLVDLLRLAKKQINILTNREISYIIITGGISELAGFEYVVENVFDRRCSILDINTMGIRSNMYSSSYGIVKYFHNKLDLRGLSYSMVSEKEANNLISTKGKTLNNSHDNIISKVFSYFSGE
jgi:cell division protein ftsA